VQISEVVVENSAKDHYDVPKYACQA
jgi:hypothetical protein